MKREILYTYLGTNGTITTPIHIEGAYYVRKLRLIAGEDKVLTKDDVNYRYSVIIPEEDEDLWIEIDDPGQD
jgi:hypothetical protein